MKGTSLYSKSLEQISGAVAEIGVWKGTRFAEYVKEASKKGFVCHAFDSFIGMNDPGPLDDSFYPKGKFDIGGPGVFCGLLKELGVEDNYEVFAGYVPDCFKKVDPEQKYSLIRIDLDHYQPTVLAANWAWPRLSVGGWLVFDDFFSWKAGFASQAAREFLTTIVDFEKLGEERDELYIRKVVK